MENKKRELAHDRHDDDDDDDDLEDEMKMEKFYSLLRSFRLARDRRRRELQELEKHESNVKKIKTSDITTTAEKPKAEASFEWQDFTTEIQFRKPPLVFPNPIPRDTVIDPKKGKKKLEQQRQDLALDLKLAL